MIQCHISRSVFRKIVSSVLLMFILAAFGVHADVIHDRFGAMRLPLNLDTEPSSLFSQCDDLATETSDCPMEYTIRGFPVYVSSYLPGGMAITVLKWLDLAGAVLLELESSWNIRGYFIERLRQSGLSFYLALHDRDETLGVTDPYFLCPVAGGCYVSGSRIVQEGLSPTHPQNTNWGSVRHFLIHELSHAFHDIALVDGFENQCVKDAYHYSVERDGLHANTYAATNHSEYFAQIVSYAMRTGSGAYCSSTPNIESGMYTCSSGLVLTNSWESVTNYPSQNKWLLSEYDFNGAALFDAFLDPEGHLDSHFPSNTDPLLNPIDGENTRDCDASIWWPE